MNEEGTEERTGENSSGARDRNGSHSGPWSRDRIPCPSDIPARGPVDGGPGGSVDGRPVDGGFPGGGPAAAGSGNAGRYDIESPAADKGTPGMDDREFPTAERTGVAEHESTARPPQGTSRKKDPSVDMLSAMAGFRSEKNPVAFIAAVFIIVPILAILIAPTFVEEEVKAFGDTEDSYWNPIYYLVLILMFTGLILLIAKYFNKRLIQLIILGAFFVTMNYAFYPLLSYLIPVEAACYAGLVMSGLLTVLLVKYPEWYVVNATGISVAVGVTAIIGISFAPGPIILLMLILMVYDAISVYKTKHMIDLADSVMEFNLPVLLVAPKKKDYTFLKKPGLKEQLASGKERDALFIGLGDIIFPSAFAVSLSVYLERHVTATDVFGLDGIIFVIAGVIIGTLLGYLVLMIFVLRGRPQAGLPLLNGGALLGYLIPVLAIYRTLGLW